MLVNERELSQVHSNHLRYLQRHHCTMNPAQEEKGGHAPAVKVGGMRVVQHKKEGEKSETPQMTPEEEAEFGANQVTKTDTHKASLLVSGVATKGDKDFTPAAVQSFHTKPMPTHDPKPRQPQNSHPIHQPR